MDKEINLKRAMNEASAFLAAADKALFRRERDIHNKTLTCATKEMAAAKRASMDLTRALSVFRNGS